MRTFLITYYTGKCSNGYAIVTAQNATQAIQILKSQGIRNAEGYRIVTIKDLFSPCEGLTIVTEGIVSQGLSAYQIAVKYGYKGTEQQWAMWLQSGNSGSALYEPSDTIPDDSECDQHGGLEPTTKEDLSKMTINEVLDKILFSEKTASIDYNSGDNTITGLTSLEVGTALDISAYTATPAKASYKYPEGTKTWTKGTLVPSASEVSFGNSNKISCTFTLDVSSLVLTTSYGTEQSSVIPKNQSKTVDLSIVGYYVLGYKASNSIPESFSSFRVTSTSLTQILQTTVQTSYVYLAIPQALTLVKTEVQDPLNTSKYNQVDNFSMVQESIEQSLSSTGIIYNLWRIGKSAENADGSVTPNSQPIKIYLTI